CSGYDLVGISSGVEFQAVRSLLSQLTQDDVWSGGNDLAQEGAFVWANGEPWSDDYWGFDQPNSGTSGNCVEVRFSSGNGGTLNDTSCDIVQPFVCERP